MNTFGEHKEEFVIPIRLHRRPTQELSDLDKQVQGIFESRGSVCKYFPQNSISAFLLMETWKEYIQNSGFSPEQQQYLWEISPPMYKQTLSVLPEVEIFYRDKDTEEYKPIILKDNTQLAFREKILFRQGYGPQPLGLVLDGSYAGLILSLKRGQRSRFPLQGFSPEHITEMVVERLMNDGPLYDPERTQYNAAGSYLLYANSKLDVEIDLEAVADKIHQLPDEIEERYRKYIQEVEEAGEPLTAVYHVQKFCAKFGFPYNPDEVNYRLP